MYQVFDNDKPADCKHYNVDPSWANSTFETYEEAREYARKWVGWMGGSYDGKCGYMELNVPWDCSGYGDMIEIRSID